MTGEDFDGWIERVNADLAGRLAPPGEVEDALRSVRAAAARAERRVRAPVRASALAGFRAGSQAGFRAGDDPGSPRDRGEAADLFRRLRGLPRYSSEHAELRDELVRRHLPLAERLARRFRDRGEPLDDLTQAAVIGLILSVDRFDPDRGVDFTRFATPTMAREIKRLFRDRNRAVPMDELPDTPDAGPDPMEAVEFREILASLLRELPPSERKVVLLRYVGLMPPARIARELDISLTRVSRTLALLRERMPVEGE
jgi:RNA polymerase sigma factor (sigma-70 family)